MDKDIINYYKITSVFTILAIVELIIGFSFIYEVAKSKLDILIAVGFIVPILCAAVHTLSVSINSIKSGMLERENEKKVHKSLK